MQLNGITYRVWDTKKFKKEKQGSLAWKMHSFCYVSSMMWIDKKVVVLLSSHALLVDPPNVSRIVVAQKSGAIEEYVCSCPMHLKYTS